MENDGLDRMEEVDVHRNTVAHPRVERPDGRLGRVLQKQIFQMLLRKTWHIRSKRKDISRLGLRQITSGLPESW